MSEQLEELQRSNQARLVKFAERGQLIDGLGTMYTNAMLEVLLGDQLEVAQVRHELKVADRLDQLEAAERKASLLAPLVQRNGQPPIQGR